VKKQMILSSAIAFACGWQIAQAQPPGGGGGFAQMSFDAINQADDEGNKDDHLTLEEVTVWLEERLAGFGGRGGGGGPDAGGRGGGMNAEAMFARWDTDPEGGDGKITEAEFDARQRGGGRGGFGGDRGGGGGGPPQ